MVQLFKFIKQHLRIKAFYGTSENAVKTQIWIAISIYVLVAIARKRLGLEKSLYQILQIFSITSLEKVPILQVFEAFDSQSELLDNSNQLILVDLLYNRTVVTYAVDPKVRDRSCVVVVFRLSSLWRWAGLV